MKTLGRQGKRTTLPCMVSKPTTTHDNESEIYHFVIFCRIIGKKKQSKVLIVFIQQTTADQYKRHEKVPVWTSKPIINRWAVFQLQYNASQPLWSEQTWRRYTSWNKFQYHLGKVHRADLPTLRLNKINSIIPKRILLTTSWIIAQIIGSEIMLCLESLRMNVRYSSSSLNLLPTILKYQFSFLVCQGYLTILFLCWKVHWTSTSELWLSHSRVSALRFFRGTKRPSKTPDCPSRT